MPKTIHFTVTEETHRKMADAKGEKSWRQACKDALLGETEA